MSERGQRVDLSKTRNTEPVKINGGQTVPEGVKKVGEFDVLREDIIYISPKPTFRNKTW